MALLRKSADVSPERTALAAAIDAHGAHLAQRDGARRAEGLADEAVARARRAFTIAEDEAEHAQSNTAQFLIRQAMGVAGDPPRTLRQAQDAVADARSELDAAKAALEAIRVEVKRLDTSWTEGKVRDAAKAVMRAECSTAAMAVGAEVVRLQTALVQAGQVLAFFVKANAVPTIGAIGSMHGQAEDKLIQTAMHRMLNSPPLTWDEIMQQRDTAAPWRAALAALETDANAPLPSVTAIASAA